MTTVPALLPGSSTTTVYYAAIPAILVGIFFRPRLVLMAIVITPIYFILLYQLLVALNVDVVLTNRQLINAVQFLIVVDFLLFVFIEYVQSLANLRAGAPDRCQRGAAQDGSQSGAACGRAYARTKSPKRKRNGSIASARL
ncbi:MAG: hypothetical protein IPK19_41555 [Chloroflexi bacterium]|nr:hypothetical protein [Chloroflexota bacterium]